MRFNVRAGDLVLPIDGLVVVAGGIKTGRSTLLEHIAYEIHTMTSLPVFRCVGPVCVKTLADKVEERKPVVITVDESWGYYSPSEFQEKCKQLQELSLRTDTPILVAWQTSRQAAATGSLETVSTGDNIYMLSELVLRLWKKDNEFMLTVQKGRSYEGASTTVINIPDMRKKQFGRCSRRHEKGAQG